MSARKFAKDGDWAEISEMSNRSLRKIIYEFAEEYHKNQVNKNESISLVSDFYLLKEGDIIREGDEFANGDSWSKTGVINERYNETDFKPHRRRITNCR